MEMSLVKRRRYRFGALFARWMRVGAFLLCGLGAAACESENACTPCMRGYYPSDPSQNCSPCKVCPEIVTDASPSNIVIWCQNRASQPDAARGEAYMDRNRTTLVNSCGAAVQAVADDPPQGHRCKIEAPTRQQACC
jgi:hypothetical protein